MHVQRPSKYPQTALKKIISYFHRVDSYVYAGYVSIEIGHSLLKTQEMLDHLVENNMIRMLSTDEKNILQIEHKNNVYVLVEKASISKVDVEL